MLDENMEGHIKKCPLLKQTQILSVQPYYQKGINQGRDDSAPDKLEQESDFTSEKKRNWVYNMTVPQFSELLSKIRSLHCSICKDIGFSYRVPHACDLWIKRQIDRCVIL